jgi:hypothetical protein
MPRPHRKLACSSEFPRASSRTCKAIPPDSGTKAIRAASESLEPAAFNSSTSFSVNEKCMRRFARRFSARNLNVKSAEHTSVPTSGVVGASQANSESSLSIAATKLLSARSTPGSLAAGTSPPARTGRDSTTSTRMPGNYAKAARPSREKGDAQIGGRGRQ